MFFEEMATVVYRLAYPHQGPKMNSWAASDYECSMLPGSNRRSVMPQLVSKLLVSCSQHQFSTQYPCICCWTLGVLAGIGGLDSIPTTGRGLLPRRAFCPSYVPPYPPQHQKQNLFHGRRWWVLPMQHIIGFLAR